ncbi:MAG: hypothetical protein WC054_11835 [Candidatus Nanopelagicales bacterium]
MADITITDTELIAKWKGFRKLGVMKGSLVVPLEDVRGAAAEPALSIGWPGLKNLSGWPGLKIIGTDAYGHYIGGTFSQNGERVMWDVANPEKAIVITLENNEFVRLILEVDDPELTVRHIEEAIGTASS